MGYLADQFSGKIADKIVDSAVDNGINSIKKNIEMHNTYVWTCVNKETSNGNILNLIFINRNGYKRRVSCSELTYFCAQNYVSNINIENGKPVGVGISLNDLPNYKVQSNGQFTLSSGRYTEQDIYNKCFRLIQAQENAIYMDSQSGNLKGQSNTKIESNFTANLSAAKDISNNAAIAATATLGTAAVVGAGAAVKAISRHMNRSKVVEMQKEICNYLNNYTDLLNIMKQMKQRTNRLCESNTSILNYDQEIDAQNETTGKLANSVKRMGVNGLITQAKDGLNKCRSRATGHSIDTEPMRIPGVDFGTLADLFDNIDSKIVEIEHLHSITLQLVNRNQQIKANADYQIELERQAEEQRQQQQNFIINEINDIEYILNYLDSKTEQQLYSIRDTEYASYNLENRINNIKNNYSNLGDLDFVLDTSERIERINTSMARITDKINSGHESVLISQCQQLMGDISQSLTDIDNGTVTTDLQSSVSKHIRITALDNKMLSVDDIVYNKLRNSQNRRAIDSEFNDLRNRYMEMKNNTQRLIESKVQDSKQEINTLLNECDDILNNIEVKLIDTDISVILLDVNNKLAKCKDGLRNLKLYRQFSGDLSYLYGRYEDLVARSDRDVLTDKYKDLDKDKTELNKLSTIISQLEYTLDTCTKIRDIETIQSRFNSNFNSLRIKRSIFQERANQMANDARVKISAKHTELVEADNTKAENRRNYISGTEQKYKDLIQTINTYRPELVTQESIDYITYIEIPDFRKEMTNLGFGDLYADDVNTLKELKSQLDTIISTKKREFNEKFRDDNTAKTKVASELARFELDISKMNSYNYVRIKDNLDSYKLSNYYLKLQVKTDVDAKIAELLVKYNEKLQELNLQ